MLFRSRDGGRECERKGGRLRRVKGEREVKRDGTEGGKDGYR